MIKAHTFKNRDEWLQGRRNYIGGSEAAAVIGLNPWQTNVDLWEIKTGRKEHEDISGKPYVIYGTKAEDHLRELFALDFPQYEVTHNDHSLYVNDKYPFAHASLDGELLEKETGRRGILEIKTTEILRSMQKEKWHNQIPDNYFVQILHYLMVTEYDFAILVAQLKYDFDGDIFKQTRHYKIERSDVLLDIAFLADAEAKFWQLVQKDKKPALLLPSI